MGRTAACFSAARTAPQTHAIPTPSESCTVDARYSRRTVHKLPTSSVSYIMARPRWISRASRVVHGSKPCPRKHLHYPKSAMSSERYKVRVTKDHLVFCSGHFISYEGDKCERLHGHNYRTAVEIEHDL